MSDAQPFLPFARPTIDEETIAAVSDVFRSGWIASGPQNAKFESALSDYCGGRPVRSFTSATGALEVALQVCGIGPGDEVIVPAMTFAATANVVVRVGAKPVFVDVERHTRNIDPAAVRAAITPRTRAIMPVHFAGLSVDLDAIYAIAREHGLRVVEDAAHAIGTTWKGRRIGSFGDFIAFSFHPNKNMTSIEGGALVIGDASAVEMVERQRFHGLTRRPDGSMDATIAGGKYNLSDVAACLGHAQLKKLDGFNERRRLLVDRYFSNLGTDAPVELPPRGEGHTWHMFAPLLDLDGMTTDRAGFISRMKDRNIGLGIHYDALHLFTVYREMGNRPGQCPNAEHIGRTTVTLPLFPTMQDSDVDRVCDAVREVIREVRK